MRFSARGLQRAWPILSFHLTAREAPPVRDTLTRSPPTAGGPTHLAGEFVGFCVHCMTPGLLLDPHFDLEVPTHA